MASELTLKHVPPTSCCLHDRMELTYNYGVDSYPLGDGFGHFGLAVNDVYKTAESIQSSGEFGHSFEVKGSDGSK